MALHAYALTTVENVQEFMRRDDLDSQLLEALINAVTDFMETYCKRRFMQTAYEDDLYDGDGTQMLFLRNYPVIEIDSIFVADQLADKDEYKIYRAGGYVYRFSRWPNGHQNIKINYIAGYDFTSEDGIPPELEYICKVLVNMGYDEPGKVGITSERMGSYSVTYSEKDLPADLKLRLNLWRRMDVV